RAPLFPYTTLFRSPSMLSSDRLIREKLNRSVMTAGYKYTAASRAKAGVTSIQPSLVSARIRRRATDGRCASVPAVCVSTPASSLPRALLPSPAAGPRAAGQGPHRGPGAARGRPRADARPWVGPGILSGNSREAGDASEPLHVDEADRVVQRLLGLLAAGKHFVNLVGQDLTPH